MIEFILAIFGYVKFPLACIQLSQKNSEAFKFLIDGCSQDLKYLSEMSAANPDHDPMRSWLQRKTLEMTMLKKALEGQDELTRFMQSVKRLIDVKKSE